MFDEDGTLEALEGVMIDVTARVENERELERTTHLLEQSQRLANLGVWELDVSSSTVWLSYEVARIAGLSVEEIADGVDLEEALSFYHPEDRPQIRRAVERAIEAGEPYDLELRLLTGDDDQRWAHTIGEPVETDGEIVALRGSIQDVTEREERERELEQTAGLLEQAERLAGSGGWALDLQSDPPETTMTDGLRELYELPPESDVEPQAGLDLPLPEDRPRVREAVEAAMERGESWDIEHRMETFQGAERWVRSVGEPVLDGEGRDSADGRTEPDDGEVVALRGSIQDITEPKERELALESLHDSARDLLGTDSRRDAAELVVETAGDVLDVDGVALYVLDDETNELDPVAYTPGFVECCGPATPVPVGAESPLWTAFATGTRTAVDDPASIERSTAFGDEVDRALLVPIGDHGMFTAVASETSITDASRRLVETLAATAEAAFDRLESEANLRERDAELAARNRRLERQIRITEIIRSIDQSLVDADSRAEIERTVCEGLVEADGIAFAWIGAVDGSGDGLDPRAWAGDEEPYLDAVSLEPGSSAEPAVTAARRNATTVVPNVVDRLTTESWRREALGRGFQSVVAVPLAYEDYAYGVLSVYADDPDAFADLERTVFAELGEGIASAINAVWAREALHEAAYTELTLRLEGTDDVLSRIARLAACRVEYEGLGAFADDATVLFVSFPDIDPDGVAAALSELVAIDEYRRIGRGDGQSRYELTVSGDVVPVRLARHGATLRSMVADETGTEVVVDVPAATDVRGFVETLRDRYGSVELRGRRDVQRDARAEGAPAAALFDELTPRQLEVLRTAYFAGFFEWPRESTGQEVAEMLGVSQPTVNRHLRLGQGRLLAQLFERTARVGPIER